MYFSPILYVTHLHSAPTPPMQSWQTTQATRLVAARQHI